MADDDRSLDDVLDGLRFAMVTTTSATGLTARPLTLLEHAGPVLRFMASKSTEWVADIAAGRREVLVAFAEAGDNRYVSLTGTASLTEDRAVIERLWNLWAGAFFEGPDDPDITVVEVTVTSGEWWDGPSGRVGRAMKMLQAAVTHDESKSGTSGAVDPR